MTDNVTVVGLVATPIKHTVTAEGLEISSFRLASSSRRYDSATKAWVDGETNWFSITTFRHLAANVHASLEKGHRVVVAGRLKVREWRNGEQLGREVEIVADALGPDLTWGRAQYTRTPRRVATEADASATSAPDAGAEAAADAADAAGFPEQAQAALATPF
jgi:single-strand DNA-binding protein